MEKIINVSVQGSEIEQSTTLGGIQGESNARWLKIVFDGEWSGLSKSVTFLDSNLENPVKILLTTENKDEDGTYLVPIPATPLLTGGKFTYIIEGTAEGILQKSVSKELKVKYTPYFEGTPEGTLVPSEADQLNLSIQNEAERIDGLSERLSAEEEKTQSTFEELNLTLEQKADKTQTDALRDDLELSLSNKADKADVEESLNLKAEKQEVREALSLKADSAYVQNALSSKADKVDVDNALYLKAEKQEVEDALRQKADIVYVDGLSQLTNHQIESLKETDRSNKADITELDERLKEQEDYIAEKTEEMFTRNDVVAPCIRESLKGGLLVADDVSPIQHLIDVKTEGETQGAKVIRCGKNLSSVPSKTLSNTIPWASSYGGTYPLPSGTYTISADYVQEDEKTTVCMSVRKQGDASVVYGDAIGGETEGKLSKTFTIPEGNFGASIYFYSNYTENAVNSKCTISNVQIEKGEEATDFEEYKGESFDILQGEAKGIPSLSPVMSLFSDTDKVTLSAEYNKDTKTELSKKADKTKVESLEEKTHLFANALRGRLTGSVVCAEDVSPIPHPITVKATGETQGAKVIRCGKNLLNLPSKTVSGTYSWVSSHSGNHPLPSGTYTISSDYVQEGEKTTVCISVRKQGDAGVTYANILSEETGGRLSRTFTIPEGEFGVSIYFYSNHTQDVVNSKCTFSNVQIEKGTKATAYEEYRGESFEILQGEAKGVESVSPVMSLFSDRDKVTLSAEYNKDLEMALDAITNAIISLGGNV